MKLWIVDMHRKKYSPIGFGLALLIGLICLYGASEPTNSGHLFWFLKKIYLAIYFVGVLVYGLFQLFGIKNIPLIISIYFVSLIIGSYIIGWCIEEIFFLDDKLKK